MKISTSLFFAVVLVEGCLSAVLPSPVNKPLVPPKMKQTDVYDDHIALTWNPVENYENNPLLGYKVKMWEEPQRQVYYFDVIDGEKKLVTKLEPVDVSMNEIPNTTPVVVTVGPNETTATVPNVKLHIRYQIRVQAFYESGEGPYSDPTGVKLGNDMPEENITKII